jgi:hypothetical protein
MKASTLYKINLLDIKIEQFCQSTAELLARIHEKYANIVKGRTLKKSIKLLKRSEINDNI